MNFSKKSIYNKEQYSEELKPLIQQANQTLKTWQANWSDFISAPTKEELTKLMAPLNDLFWISDGGYEGAEREVLMCCRSEQKANYLATPAPIKGLLIKGNFLFDNANNQDFRKALQIMGAPPEGIGDIWIINDRGAHAICTNKTAELIENKTGLIREVSIICEPVEIRQLDLPRQRGLRIFNTVEASKRLDAIASAGFGLSRSKITQKIKSGELRLNWQSIQQISKELKIGDRLQLEKKGQIEILNIQLTKKERWRIEIKRQ
tara:strand:- start:297 stop:1085 length:789 start_codon:yes stop_codon:yes gene_type:complete